MAELVERVFFGDRIGGEDFLVAQLVERMSQAGFDAQLRLLQLPALAGL